MNESSHGVRRDQSEGPHDQENYKNSPKHVQLLSREPTLPAFSAIDFSMPAVTSQSLTLDHLQVISDSFDAFYLRRDRTSARLLVGGLDFAGQDHDTVVGLDADP
jgi:hypothetical protein